jgi:hypothetical protein
MIAEIQGSGWSELLTSRLRWERMTMAQAQESPRDVSNPAQYYPRLAVMVAVTVLVCSGHETRDVFAKAPADGGSMTLDRLRTRFRIRFAGISASVAQLFAALKPGTHGVRLQRMCPFCGLITPRSERSCLECGKVLEAA